MIISALLLSTTISAGATETVSYALPGDTDGDYSLSVNDVTAVQKSIANMLESDEISKISADYNGDDQITVTDATAIQKELAGLKDSCFVEKDNSYLTALYSEATYKADNELNKDIIAEYDLISKSSFITYSSSQLGVPTDKTPQLALISSANQFYALTGLYSPEFNDEFFESKALICGYTICNDEQYEADLDYVGVENNTMYVRLKAKFTGDDPQIALPTLRPWLVYYSVDKACVSDVDNIVLYK